MDDDKLKETTSNKIQLNIVNIIRREAVRSRSAMIPRLQNKSMADRSLKEGKRIRGLLKALPMKELTAGREESKEDWGIL